MNWCKREQSFGQKPNVVVFMLNIDACATGPALLTICIKILASRFHTFRVNGFPGSQ
jgi:hypothetical protein